MSLWVGVLGQEGKITAWVNTDEDPVERKILMV
jgi:hypothetical protein